MMRRPKRMRPVQRPCYYCETKTLPHYREILTLEKFVTERGKIISRSRSGICSKHQRILSKAIKRARHVALLPFVVKM